MTVPNNHELFWRAPPADLSDVASACLRAIARQSVQAPCSTFEEVLEPRPTNARALWLSPYLSAAAENKGGHEYSARVPMFPVELFSHSLRSFHASRKPGFTSRSGPRQWTPRFGLHSVTALFVRCGWLVLFPDAASLPMIWPRRGS